MFDIHDVSALIFCQKEWKLYRMLCFGTFIFWLDLILHVHILVFISIREHKAEEKSCTWSQKMVELSLRKQVYSSHLSSFHGLNLSLRRFLSPEEANSVLWRAPLYKWHKPEAFRKPFEEMNWEFWTWFKFCGKPGVGSWDRADMLMVNHVSEEVLPQQHWGWKPPLEIV